MPSRLVEQAKVEEAQKLATKLVAHPSTLSHAALASTAAGQDGQALLQQAALEHTDAEVCASVVCLNVWTIRLDHTKKRH